MNVLSEQEEELVSIESIFNVYEKNVTFQISSPPCGHFKANVWLPTPFHVTYKTENTSNTLETITTDTETFEIKNLPPINLFFELPETYPCSTCPAFLLSCNWMTLGQLSKLCKHLESLWDKDIPVLYLWFQFLESEVVDFLDLHHCLDITELLSYKWPHACAISVKKENCNDSKTADSKKNPTVIKPSITGGSGTFDKRALNDLPNGQSLINLLKSYNEFKTLDVFNRKYHECNICLTSKVGSEFATFKLCNHSFCKDCLKSFFEVHIREGNVNCLGCPSGKCNSQADNSIIRQIVDKDLFERYDGILLSRTLETMSDITYCPRSWCQCVVLIDSDERMGSCPLCSFVFCTYCKMGYHGVAPCNFKFEQKQEIYEQYTSGDRGVIEKLEKKHGKQTVKLLVEDMLSESWKNSNSKSCPRCKANIEKTDGCNKMTCFKCGTFFCWLCMSVLESVNPYRHFNEERNCILFPDDEMDDFFEFGPGEFLHFL